MYEKAVMRKSNEGKRFMFFCPACKCGHFINDTWKFNGDFEKPTISPSILVRGYGDNGKEIRLCHSFVKEGMIQFLNDCQHDLKGQTVPLEKF